MSHETHTLVGRHEINHSSGRSYGTGFIIAILLTNAAFLLVVSKALTGWGLAAALSALAVAQLWVQLRFFLHLGREDKPKWNLLMFLFAVMVVVILVFGSLWIMKNLNYHSMTPQDTDKSIIEDEGIKR